MDSEDAHLDCSYYMLAKQNITPVNRLGIVLVKGGGDSRQWRC